jgi:hypothetical protein
LKKIFSSTCYAFKRTGGQQRLQGDGGKRRNTWVAATRQHIRSGAKRLHRIQKKHAKVMLSSYIQTVCGRKLEREGKIKMKAK